MPDKPNAIEEIGAKALRDNSWDDPPPDWDDMGTAKNKYIEDIRTVLAALEAHGLKVMPVEATEAMGKAAALGSSQYALDEALALWSFMLDAFDPTTWKPGE